MFRFRVGWRCLPALTRHGTLKDSAMSYKVIPAAPGTIAYLRRPSTTQDKTSVVDVRVPVIAWLVDVYEDEDPPDAGVYPVGPRGVIRNISHVSHPGINE